MFPMNKGKHEKMALQGNRPATPFFFETERRSAICRQTATD